MVSNHQPHDCLLNRLFRRRSKKASKLRVTGLCAGNSPETGEFPTQRASNAENVSIWWRHNDTLLTEVRWRKYAVVNCVIIYLGNALSPIIHNATHLANVGLLSYYQSWPQGKIPSDIRPILKISWKSTHTFSVMLLNINYVTLSV